MPSPSARLAQFRRLLSSETKVPVRLGAEVGAPGRGKTSSRRGTDSRRDCGERPCAEERFGRPGSRGRTEQPRRRGRGGRRPCAPSTGGRAHLAPAHLSGWAARPESEGKGRREAKRSRRSRRCRRRRLPDSGESPPGTPGPASTHVIPGPPLPPPQPPPLAGEAASSAQPGPGAATWPAPAGGPGLLSREPPRGCSRPLWCSPILPGTGEAFWSRALSPTSQTAEPADPRNSPSFKGPGQGLGWGGPAGCLRSACPAPPPTPGSDAGADAALTPTNPNAGGRASASLPGQRADGPVTTDCCGALAAQSFSA